MKNYVDRSVRELEKSIRNLEKNVQEHIRNLENPADYIEDFFNKSEDAIRGQIHQWKNHMLKSTEEKNIIKGILDKLK